MPINDVQYRYFALDSDHSLAASPLDLSLDGVTGWTAATYQAVTPPAATGLAVPTGLTRYWWRVLLGPGQSLVPTSGRPTIYGRLTDAPEILYRSWKITV